MSAISSTHLSFLLSKPSSIASSKGIVNLNTIPFDNTHSEHTTMSGLITTIWCWTWSCLLMSTFLPLLHKIHSSVPVSTWQRVNLNLFSNTPMILKPNYASMCSDPGSSFYNQTYVMSQHQHPYITWSVRLHPPTDWRSLTLLLHCTCWMISMCCHGPCMFLVDSTSSPFLT